MYSMAMKMGSFTKGADIYEHLHYYHRSYVRSSACIMPLNPQNTLPGKVKCQTQVYPVPKTLSFRYNHAAITEEVSRNPSEE